MVTWPVEFQTDVDVVTRVRVSPPPPHGRDYAVVVVKCKFILKPVPLSTLIEGEVAFE